MLTVFVTYHYFLGLRTLTVIDNAVKLVEKNRGIKLDMSKIDEHDPKVYALIASGNTEGVFQLESAGMKNFMKELAPTCLEDIIAGVSLYRPGPMDFIPKYIEGKRDAHRISYTHPKLEPILNNTYGCIVYQEQVMQIVRDLAGYSLGRSDLLRRAMGKKKIDVMNKEREIFLHGDGQEVPGCIANGIDEKTANKIFDEMVDFAKYAFNKSHAAAYAVVAYQTAYLKTYYKVEFMAALMTSIMENTSKITGYMETCKKMKIEVLPPDINEGFAYFDVKEDKILFGLAAIKNVGKNVVDRIVEEREAAGKFKSLTDFYNRMDSKDTNKRSIENLILAGAFDSLGGKRSQYISVYKQIADGISHTRKNNISGQMDLFALGGEETMEDKDHLPDMDEFDSKELLAYEKEVLGIYLSGHPLDKVRSVLEQYVNMTSDRIQMNEEEEVELQKLPVYDGQVVIVGGMVVDKKVIFTKNNNKMAFLTLEDIRGTMEVVIFPNLYERYMRFPEESVLLIKGRISIKEESNVVVLAEEITSLADLINLGTNEPHVLLKLDESQRTAEMRGQLLKLFMMHRGNVKVIVENREDGTRKAFPAKYNVKVSEEFVNKLTSLLKDECVIIRN